MTIKFEILSSTARHVGTKSVKDCVEFYYLWKNICHEESQSFKSLFAQSESQTESDAVYCSDALSKTASSAAAGDRASSAAALSSTVGSKTEVQQSGPSSVSSVV